MYNCTHIKRRIQTTVCINSCQFFFVDKKHIFNKNNNKKGLLQKSLLYNVKFNLMLALLLSVYIYSIMFKVALFFSLKHGVCQCWSVRGVSRGPWGASMVCGVSRALETRVLLTMANQAA